MSEVMPCPHFPEPDVHIASPMYEPRLSFVYCDSCGMRGPTCKTREAAIAAWNSLPRALRWTNEPPKVAGWYFQRTAGEYQTINVAYVYSGLAGLYCKCGCRNTPLKCWIGFEWAGPIPPPID